MRKPSALPALIFVLIVLVGFGIAWATSRYPVASAVVAIATLIVALVVSSSIKVADQWEKVVVLRLGRFRSLEGPGLFFIIPIIESVAYWIDTRVITATFKAEKTLTKDTVPVDVDAVLFWKVVDPKMAALGVADYVSRDQLGVTDRAPRRHRQDRARRHARGSGEDQRRIAAIIDARTEPWGVNVISVELKDVLIPPALQDAMSMQAQAERERQARVILGDSERQIAEKFNEAAKTYADNPTAFHLRAMNMLYEGLKRNNATIVIVPSTAVETMQLGGMTGLTTIAGAMAQTRGTPIAPPASS